MWRRCSAGRAGFQLRKRGEVEFVRVVGGDPVVFQMGFAVGDLRHEVVVLGLALLELGPVGVAEMSGAVQGIPWGTWVHWASGSVRSAAATVRRGGWRQRRAFLAGERREEALEGEVVVESLGRVMQGFRGAPQEGAG